MSGTARRRGSRGRFSRSNPPAAEDPEALEEDQAEYGDGNASPQREDGAASPILTPNTAQLELEERTTQARRDGKRPVARDAGVTPASPQLPESSTLSTGTDVQFQAQLAEVARQEQQLLQQIELAKASARVAQLEEQLCSISIPFQVRAKTTSKHCRHHGMKPKEPGIYAAKNLREHNEWLLDVENVFTTMYHEYRHDADKVAHAQRWLRGDHRATWNRHLEASEKGVTFSEFCEVLLDMLQNPVLRTYSTVRRYLAAQQRKDQSVVSFVAYLDTLEGEMLSYTDDQRRMHHLLCKLRPDLQQTILQHGEAPPTRDELITLAIRLEDVKKMGTQHDLAGKAKAEAPKSELDKKKESSRGGGPSTARGGNAHHRGGRGRSAGGATSTPHPTGANASAAAKKTDLSGVRCYNCGKKGHFANVCRAPKSEKATGPS